MAKTKFKILIRAFDTTDATKQFRLIKITTSKSKEKLWEEVANDLTNSYEQAWVLNEKEYSALKKILRG